MMASNDRDPTPTVSVVMPARNAAGTIAAAVASALGQGVDDLEVVIAVGPSEDGTEDVAARLAADPRVRVVGNPTGVTPAALNAAVAASRGDVIVRLDAHAELPAGYVATAVEVLDETGAGNVGGRQVPQADEGTAAAIAAAMRSPLGSGGAAYRTGTVAGPVETVYLGVFRREALAEVGGFDETLLRNQDYELNHRLIEAGWTVWFDPRLAVAYHPRGSLGALGRQYRDYGRFKRVVMRRHLSSVRARQLAPLVMVLGVVGSLVVGGLVGTWWPPVVVCGGYLGLVLIGGVVADRRRAVLVAAALATMHWAWAVGFLEGTRVAATRGGRPRSGTTSDTSGDPR